MQLDTFSFLLNFLNMIQGEGIMIGKSWEWGKIELVKAQQTP